MTTCLIVDDSPLFRAFSSQILENIGGFEVRVTEDGDAALKACKELMPDLILLDWYMPNMDGIAFIKRLRVMPGGGAPKVIFCTTENEINHIARAMQAGADEYIMKPFDEDVVRIKLAQVGFLEARQA